MFYRLVLAGKVYAKIHKSRLVIKGLTLCWLGYALVSELIL
jgi:hypothetical protein